MVVPLRASKLGQQTETRAGTKTRGEETKRHVRGDRRIGAREMDTYIYMYIFIERKRKREREGRERSGRNEGSTTATLCRHFHESSSEQAVASLPVSCTPNRKSIACDVYRNPPFNYDRALPLASKVIVALSKIAPRCTVLLNSPTRLRSVIFGRSRLLH